jgi:hypothetical protein
MNPALIVLGPFFLIFGLLILGFLGLVIKLILNAKNDSWQGKIIGKKIVEREDFETDRLEQLYSLQVKLDNGKIRNIGVSLKLYQQFKEGDSILKEKGSLQPKKV